MQRTRFLVIFALVILAAVVVMSLSVSEPALAQDGDVLTSAPVTEAPTLDGVADDAMWETAEPFVFRTERGANESASTVTMRSVYDDGMVYFLLEWEDPTESWERALWEMQEDGSWIQLTDPEDLGGDNNLWYEDKMAVIWNINNSIADFNTEGCDVACHRNEEAGNKPYGNKYTMFDGELGDIWHWKSIRNVGQIDDQYLDNTQWSAETPEAGRHSDPKDGGGYSNNITEDKTGPAFMPAGDFPHDGNPGYILASEAVPFDPSLFQPGDRLPAIIVEPIVGDRGDISAGWQWVDGVWTLEFGRALETGSEFDVQFNDLSMPYYFGVATFDNAQVRHAVMENDVAALVFGQ